MIRLLFLAALILATACDSLVHVTEDDRRAYRTLHYSDAWQVPETAAGNCELHHVPKQYSEVHRYAGMCVGPPNRYLRAVVHQFPNSYWGVNTCFCEPDGISFALRYVCPVCRAAERRWRLRHGWSIEDEKPVGGVWP